MSVHAQQLRPFITQPPAKICRLHSVGGLGGGVIVIVNKRHRQLTAQELGSFGREGLTPVVVVVNTDGYTVERAIHGESAYYNDIVGWRWTELPRVLGAHDVLA